MRYYTSDLHIGHKKLLEKGYRPFSSIEEHDAVIQDNINRVVGKTDTLVIIGDVSFLNVKGTLDWLGGITCRNIHVVFGNHDSTTRKLAKRFPKTFVRASDCAEFNTKVGDTQWIFYCSHCAHRAWPKCRYGSINLFGDAHGTMPDNGSRSMDVGVDTHLFVPWSETDIIEIMKDRPVVFEGQQNPNR